MLQYLLLEQIAADRMREIERRSRLRRELGPRPPRPPVRRIVGRSLIQIGSLLAAEGPLQPASER